MAIRRNSIVNLVGSLAGLILFALLTPLYFHVIGSERYGILAIIWVFLTFFAAFDFGMGAALTYRIANEARSDIARQADYFWTAMAISLPVGLIAGAILFGVVGGGFGNIFKLTPAISAELLHALLPLLAIGVSTILLTTINGFLIGREYFLANAVLGSVGPSLSILLPVLAALLISPSLDILILATLAGRVIVVLAGLAVSQFMILRNTRPTVSGRSARALASYGAWMSVGGLIELTVSSADRFILGLVAGPAAVGYYSVPASVLARLMIFPTSIATAALPQLASRSAAEEVILARKIVAMVAVLTPCFVAGEFLAGPFLRLWMGPVFAKVATLPMQLLLPAFWMEAMAAILYFRLLAQGRPRAIAVVAAGMLLPYCLLMYVLVSAWGLPGACVAYIGRNLMFLGGRVAVTRSWRLMAVVVGPEALSLVTALAICLFAWPAQPPILVGVLVTLASIALALKRRPAEFDAMLRDFARPLSTRFSRPAALDAGSNPDG
ncbi:MAG: oligosaccharide flippase family protein [Sphingomonas bacterium]